MIDQTNFSRNPFRELLLPLAYDHAGLLHALLGLTASHMQVSHPSSSTLKTEAIEHRLEAIRHLNNMLSYQEMLSAGDASDDVALATILILVLHDVCRRPTFSIPPFLLAKIL